jgi:hypothetical protein
MLRLNQDEKDDDNFPNSAGVPEEQQSKEYRATSAEAKGDMVGLAK